MSPLKAWFLASRPKTLTCAAAPIAVALAAAWNVKQSIDITPALLCLAFALVMQIDANFVNDYYDCLNGTDNATRLGPERACAQGWISLKSMRLGIIITTVLAAIIGAPLILWGGYSAIIVGVVCILFTFLYTTMFSRKALGDVLVILFFGIIPVSFTYYFQLYGAGPFSLFTTAAIWDIPTHVWTLAVAQGLVTDLLLLVNNFRDRDQDRQAGKVTLVTKVGAKFATDIYLWLGIIAVIHVVVDFKHFTFYYNMLPVLSWLIVHLLVWRKLRLIWHGRRLNTVLGLTSLSIILFSIIVSLCLILG